MNKITTLIIFLIISILFSCSESKSPVASVSHEEGWTEINSETFHASKVQIVGAVSCRSCHGKEIEQGVAGTFCIDCHQNHPNATFPHKEGWNSFDDPNSHGDYVKANGLNLTCNKCHTGDYAIARSCDYCH